MASAWGSSWGSYWGNSWGSILVPTETVLTGGGSSKRLKPKRKVFVLPNGKRVIATEEEIEKYLNPTPGPIALPSFIEINVDIPATNIPYLWGIVNELEEDEEILVAAWLMQ